MNEAHPYELPKIPMTSSVETHPYELPKTKKTPLKSKSKKKFIRLDQNQPLLTPSQLVYKNLESIFHYYSKNTKMPNKSDKLFE